MKKWAARVAALELWIVALAVVVGAASERALPLTLVVIIALWGMRWWTTNRWSQRTIADLPIGLLVLMSLVSLAITARPAITSVQVYRLWAGIAFYYALINSRQNPSQLRRLLLGVVGLGLLLSLIAPLSVEWSGSKFPLIPLQLYQRFTLLVSDTINPNVMAGALVLIWPCATALLLFNWSQFTYGERTIYVIAALAISLMLVLTQSRGGLLAAGIIGALLLALRWPRHWRIWLTGWSTIVLTLPFAVAQGWLDALWATDTLNSLSERVEIWSRALFILQDFSFTGVGMGTFGPVTDLLYPLFLIAPETVSHAHNLFLQVGVDLGVPGLMAWLTIVWLMNIAAWQTYRLGVARADSWFMGLGAGLLGSQIALLTHGLLDAVTWGTRSAFLVWALWGLMVTTQQIARQEINSCTQSD